jgi:hypothetical protein
MADDRERVFRPADQMIQHRFARDALQIVRSIPLPPIPIQCVRQGRKGR